MAKKGDLFYKVWIQNMRVVGEVYSILDVDDNIAIVLDRKNKKTKANLLCPDIIWNKKQSIDKYYYLLNILKSNEKRKCVGYNDEIELVIDDVEMITTQLVQLGVKIRPVWTANRYKRIDYKTEYDSLKKGEMSADAPIARAVLGKHENERCFYCVGRVHHFVTINKITKFKNEQLID